MRDEQDTLKYQARESVVHGKEVVSDLFPKEALAARKAAKQRVSSINDELDGFYGLKQDPKNRGNYMKHGYEHPELYAAYPELQNYVLRQGNSSDYLGSIQGSNVNLSQSGLARSPTSTLAHEMQHGVQGIEGTPRGGNLYEFMEARNQAKRALQNHEDNIANLVFEKANATSPAVQEALSLQLAQQMARRDKVVPYAKLDPEREYRLLGGEAEARAVQARLNMTPEERANTYPLNSYDENPKHLRNLDQGENIDIYKAEGGSITEEMRKAIQSAAKSAGMKAPVVATKDLTNVQDFHASLGDQVRQRAGDMQDLVESMPFKYDVGHRVFTEDSAKKNRPPYTILHRKPFGNQPMREKGSFKTIKDPQTGKAVRTPYEPGYRVRHEQDGDSSDFDIPESAIKGRVTMSKGGSIKELEQYIRKDKGEYGARRVHRAADEIPNLENLYSLEALKRAFSGDNAQAMMTMDPAHFEHYASPIPERTKRWPGKESDKENLPTADYIRYLQKVGAFHDVPMLDLNKEEAGLPLTPFISGHEGRHRNRAMAQNGQKKGIVRMLPRAELREPFPRRSQEDYIEAMKKELAMTKGMVLPQRYSESKDNGWTEAPVRRPAIKMPDIYAKGGTVTTHDIKLTERML
jgi:hypothetical protein